MERPVAHQRDEACRATQIINEEFLEISVLLVGRQTTAEQKLDIIRNVPRRLPKAREGIFLLVEILANRAVKAAQHRETVIIGVVIIVGF